MAISRSSKKVQRIEVFPAHDSSAADDANAKYPIINVFYDSTLAGTGADSDVDGIVAGTSVFLTKFAVWDNRTGESDSCCRWGYMRLYPRSRLQYHA